jgi:hypothetical protein
MPRRETVLYVFIATPSDLEPERSAVVEAISEWNDAWGREVSIRLEPLQWERHSYSDFGEDPQATINAQMGDDYDIFIGMLWAKFGTPTPRSSSGTAEEFERAFSRLTKDQGGVRVMFYFKDAPVRPSEVDGDQLRLISQFRDKIKNLGLYHTFTKTEELGKLIRIHLGRQVQEWRKKDRTAQGLEEVIGTSSPNRGYEAPVSVDEGLLDLVQKGTINFEALTQVAARLRSYIEEYSFQTQAGTKRLVDLGPVASQSDISKKKEVVNDMAKVLDTLSGGFEREIPEFKATYSSAIDAYGRGATLALEFDSADLRPIKDALPVVVSLENTLSESKAATSGFMDVISTIPPVTQEFNVAKRRSLTAIQSLVDEMGIALNLTREVRRTLEELLS